MKVLPAGTPQLKNDRFYGDYAILEIWGLGDLAAGNYTLKAWNSGKSKTIDFKIVQPNTIKNTDQNARMNQYCGIVPSTLPGKVYPPEINLTLASKVLATDLQGLKLIDRDTDTVIASYTLGTVGEVDKAWVNDDQIHLPLNAAILDGKFEVWAKVSGVWIPGGTWNKVSGAAADLCQTQVKHFNEIDPTLCNDTDLYLDEVSYIDSESAYLNHVTNPIIVTKPFKNNFSLIGNGFTFPYPVQSISLEQPGEAPIWDKGYSDGKPLLASALDGYSGGSIVTTFDSLSAKLVPGKKVTVKFYPASKADVEKYGVPPIGKTVDWREAKSGVCPKSEQITPKITGVTPTSILPKVFQGHSSSWEYYDFTVRGVGLPYLVGKGGLQFKNSAGTESLYYPSITPEWHTKRQTNADATVRIDTHYRSIEDYEITTTAPGLVDTKEYLESAALPVVSVGSYKGLPALKLLEPLARPVATAAGELLNINMRAVAPALESPLFWPVAAFYMGYKVGGIYASITQKPALHPATKPDTSDDSLTKRIYLVHYHQLIDDNALTRRATVVNDFRPDGRVIVIKAKPAEAELIARKALAIRYPGITLGMAGDELSIVNDLAYTAIPFNGVAIVIHYLEEVLLSVDPKAVPYQVYYGIGARFCPPLVFGVITLLDRI